MAGFQHPAVLVTAQRVPDSAPSVVHVVPLTSTARAFHSEVAVEPGSFNGLAATSSAQCQHVRSVGWWRSRCSALKEVLASADSTLS